MKHLDPRHDGLRIAQLSDIHVGKITPRAHVRAAVASANAAKPDLIVLTGDYVGWRRDEAELAGDQLAGLEAPRVLAVLVKNKSVQPKRTITMLFGLEIQQTRNFLADDSVRTRGVKWGMSLDMTGEDASRTGGTFLIEKMPDPSASGGAGTNIGGPSRMESRKP